MSLGLLLLPLAVPPCGIHEGVDRILVAHDIGCAHEPGSAGTRVSGQLPLSNQLPDGHWVLEAEALGDLVRREHPKLCHEALLGIQLVEPCQGGVIGV